MPNPIQASKCLHDLAIAQGCKTDISVVVIKLNINSDVPPPLATNRKQLRSIVQPEESEDEEEDPRITNIDDVITDSEEAEEEEGGGGGKSTQGHKDGGKDLAMSAELDRLVLNAVHSPDSSPYKPTMESTTFDDEDDFHDHSPSHPAGGASAPSDLTNHVANERIMVPVMEYEAQTLPTANKPRKTSYEVPVNGGYAILSETSYEQTQVRRYTMY